MVNSASQYGIGNGLPPLHGGRDLAYDTYVEQAKTRAAAQASVAFQALQTGLLSEMSNSMDAVQAQMEAVRQQQGEALAIQQELLNREQIQSHIEEFIFQAEKLVAECSKTTTDIPASSRYFLLMGVLGKIEDDGIGTPIIKGRDNKSAFEKVVDDTKGLTQRLLKDPEVQEAIKWAEVERKRLEAEQEQADRERRAKVNKLEQQLNKLQSELKTISIPEEVKFQWGRLERLMGIKPDQRKVVLVVCLLLSPIFIFAIPIFAVSVFVDAKKREYEANSDTREQIESVMQRLAELREVT